MFSATFPPEIRQSAMDFLENYVFVTIGVIGGACADVQQIFYQVEKREKREKVMELFRDFRSKDKVPCPANARPKSAANGRSLGQQIQTENAKLNEFRQRKADDEVIAYLFKLTNEI